MVTVTLHDDIGLGTELKEIKGYLAHIPLITERIGRRRKDLNELIKEVKVSPYQIPASGILDDYRAFAPDKGFVLDVTRISVQGFSSGTVTVYIQSVQDEEIDTFTSAGSLFLNPRNILISSRSERLVFQSTGATGAAVSMRAISVHESVLGEYLKS